MARQIIIIIIIIIRGNFWFLSPNWDPTEAEIFQDQNPEHLDKILSLQGSTTRARAKKWKLLAGFFFAAEAFFPEKLVSVAAAAESAIKSESLASLGVCLCTPSVRKLSADEGTQRKDMIQVG